MRLAVCGMFPGEREIFRGVLLRCCSRYGITPAVEELSAVELLGRGSGSFQAAYVGFGGGEGFLAARALRDRDRNCRIVLVDDTDRYAVRAAHLHFPDLLLRPVTEEQVERSFRLVLGLL